MSAKVSSLKPMSQLERVFASSAPVIPFLTAGFPSRGVFLDSAKAAFDAGAGALEIGIPFSDPLADGPAIQHSSQVALANGIDLDKVLELAAKLSRISSVPILLMGYLNPILRQGLDQFALAARQAGVAGTIIPDCPIEEATEWVRASRRQGLANVFLIAPTTPSDRIALIDRHSTAFSYCVSVTGVTGARRGVATATKKFLRRVGVVAKKPFVVGFGISKPEHIRDLWGLADGFVVGSALVEVILKSPRSKAASRVGQAVRRLVAAT